MFGTTSNQFDIPNTASLPTNFILNGNNTFDSSKLNETQSELNQFAVVALQGTNGGALDYQVALFTRYSRTQFNPDPVAICSSTAWPRTIFTATARTACKPTPPTGSTQNIRCARVYRFNRNTRCSTMT